MLAHPTLDRLNAMGLAGMAKAFGDSSPTAKPNIEWLGLLLEREWSSRYDRKLAARLRFAKLRHQATPEDVDYRTERGLDRALFMKLLGGDWISAHDNLAICGPSGVGKSWLACALGHKACRDDRSVLYQRVPRLFAQLALARGDGRYARLQRTLGHVQVLILDDWGLEPLNEQARHDFWKSLRTATAADRRSLPASSPYPPGIASLVTPPTPAPSWIASSTTPTASNSAEKAYVEICLEKLDTRTERIGNNHCLQTPLKQGAQSSRNKGAASSESAPDSPVRQLISRIG